MDRKAAIFIAMGFEIVGLVLVGVYVGRWFDAQYGWQGLGVGTGVMTGLACWITHLIVLAKQFDQSSGSGDSDSP